MTIVGSVLDHEGVLSAELSESYMGTRDENPHTELIDLAMYYLNGRENGRIPLGSIYDSAIVLSDVDSAEHKTLSFVFPVRTQVAPVARRAVISLTETQDGEVFGDSTLLSYSLTNPQGKQNVEGYNPLRNRDHARLQLVKSSLENWILADRSKPEEVA